jgi:hypothetical protein
MCFACWVTNTTDTRSEYGVLLFHSINGYVNAFQCYTICALPVWLAIHGVSKHCTYRADKL